MQAIILAAGFGNRLKDVTGNEIPKPMVKVNDKPFLEHQINMLKRHGFDNIIIHVAYLKEVIKNYFKDGKDFGVKINYIEADIPIGTAGWIHKIKDKSIIEDNFIVTYGDSYLDLDYKYLFDLHSEYGLMCTMTVTEGNQHVHNNIYINEDQYKVEKYDKEEAKGNYVDAGVIAFNKDILDYVKKYYTSNFVMFEDVTSQRPSIYQSLIENEDLMVYITNEKFYDVGTPERLEAFKKILR